MNVFPFKGLASSDGEPSPYPDCAMMFLGLEVPDAPTIDDGYVRWTESNVPPPITLIVGTIDAMRTFHKEHVKADGKLSKLDRLYNHGDVILCGFDYAGTISRIDGNAPVDLTGLFGDAITSFVSQRIEETDVVIPAPPGIFFDKLSTRFSSHFIRAEALLQSTACIEMMALRILKPFHEWFARSSIATSGHADIFIDTMSVWPVAEKLCQLYRVCNSNLVQFRIESFKSYEGLAKWKPGTRPAFVIISATTSGGLAEKVRGKIGGANAEVWTLLELAQVKNDCDERLNDAIPKSIYQLPRLMTGRPSLDGMRAEFQPDVKTLPAGAETISIVGERFLSQPAKPKRVRLVHKSLDDATKKTLAGIAEKDIVRVGRGRFDARSRWSISFDFDMLLDMACTPKQPGGQSLLKNWIKNYSSPSPVAIVYLSGEGTSALEVADAAVKFAERTEIVLRELTPGAQTFTISSNELAKASKPPPYEINQCSIIVVAPVIGNGFALKQISALLRQMQPKGPRLFLALAVLPESQVHFNQLKSDISVSMDDRSYEFKYQFMVPIGRLDTTIQWSDEIEVLQELDDKMAEAQALAPKVSARTSLLDEYKVLDRQSVFLPSKDEKSLLLSTGFFLWPGSVNVQGDNYGGAVLLSIAALLQAVRSSASREDATSLKTGLFQHALICPETFTRFNDAVIQAALLRAAYPAELNYSVSPEMSRDMGRLLLKWLQYYDQPAGAASAEFLLAIAIGKLKLRKDDQDTVLNFAKNRMGWISCLAVIAETRTAVPAQKIKG